MRRTWQHFWVGLPLILVACGGDGGKAKVFDGSNTSGKQRDGGDEWSPDAGSDPNAPTVTITSLRAASNPNGDTVVTTPMLKVACRVARSSSSSGHGVDQSTVKIDAVYIPDPDRPTAEKGIEGVVNAQGKNEFEAEFNLSE